MGRKLKPFGRYPSSVVVLGKFRRFLSPLPLSSPLISDFSRIYNKFSLPSMGFLLKKILGCDMIIALHSTLHREVLWLTI